MILRSFIAMLYHLINQLSISSRYYSLIEHLYQDIFAILMLALQGLLPYAMRMLQTYETLMVSNLGFDETDARRAHVGEVWDALVERLHQPVTDAVPRLANESGRRTVGDEMASSLELGQIVLRTNVDHTDSPALSVHFPAAEKLVAPNLLLPIAHWHLDQVVSCLDDRMTTKWPRFAGGYPVTELSSHGNTHRLGDTYPDFINDLHPTIEGHTWYRGRLVSATVLSRLLVTQPWMQPHLEQGSPLPVAYTIGTVGSDRLRDIVSSITATPVR